MGPFQHGAQQVLDSVEEPAAESAIGVDEPHPGVAVPLDAHLLANERELLLRDLGLFPAHEYQFTICQG